MKKIEAIVKPLELDDVREILAEIGIIDMTVSKAKGFDRQEGYTEIYRGAEYVADLLPGVRIGLVLADDEVDQAVDVILETARPGGIGNDKIFICPVEEAVRIRTDERPDTAL